MSSTSVTDDAEVIDNDLTFSKLFTVSIDSLYELPSEMFVLSSSHKASSILEVLSAIVAFVRRMDFPYLVVLVTGSSLWNTLAVTVTYKYKDVIQTVFVKKNDICWRCIKLKYIHWIMHYENKIKSEEASFITSLTLVDNDGNNTGY